MNSNSSNSSNTNSTIRSSNIFLLRTFHYEPNVDAALSMSVIFAVLTVAFIAQTGVYGGWSQGFLIFLKRQNKKYVQDYLSYCYS
jgi:hypothetical protein